MLHLCDLFTGHWPSLCPCYIMCDRSFFYIRRLRHGCECADDTRHHHAERHRQSLSPFRHSNNKEKVLSFVTDWFLLPLIHIVSRKFVCIKFMMHPIECWMLESNKRIQKEDREQEKLSWLVLILFVERQE
jgi:hypothetical protein